MIWVWVLLALAVLGVIGQLWTHGRRNRQSDGQIPPTHRVPTKLRESAPEPEALTEYLKVARRRKGLR